MRLHSFFFDAVITLLGLSLPSLLALNPCIVVLSGTLHFRTWNVRNVEALHFLLVQHFFVAYTVVLTIKVYYATGVGTVPGEFLLSMKRIDNVLVQGS